MPRSELSEILENVNNANAAGGLDANVMRDVVQHSSTVPPTAAAAAVAALELGMGGPEQMMTGPAVPVSMSAMSGIVHGLPDVEIEGQSPGLDALAMAAGAVV